MNSIFSESCISAPLQPSYDSQGAGTTDNVRVILELYIIQSRKILRACPKICAFPQGFSFVVLFLLLLVYCSLTTSHGKLFYAFPRASELTGGLKTGCAHGLSVLYNIKLLYSVLAFGARYALWQ